LYGARETSGESRLIYHIEKALSGGGGAPSEGVNVGSKPDPVPVAARTCMLEEYLWWQQSDSLSFYFLLSLTRIF
jgi:hypothetical protein